MKPVEVRVIAKPRSVIPGDPPLSRLIGLIQATTSNVHCFATARDGICEHAECSWRGYCLGAIGKGVLS